MKCRPLIALGQLVRALSSRAIAPPTRIYIANDDHTGFMRTADAETYARVFVEMLVFHLALADATEGHPPAYRNRFNADGSYWLWNYERNKSPAECARLVERIRDGSIGVPMNALVACYGGQPAEGSRLLRILASDVPSAGCKVIEILPGERTAPIEDAVTASGEGGSTFENAALRLVIFSTSTSSGFPAAGISASFNLSIVHDYFLERHQRNSINGQGGTIVGVINVPIDNAFWNQGVITLGSADAGAESLDFVAHEMAHGVTERTAGSIYRNQSGAMNEAFSDIFGEATEAYHRGQPDWRIGSQLATRSRDMKDPAAFEIRDGRRYPSRMSELVPANDSFLTNWPGRDNGGVHFNSSIINHAFYQLAEGLADAIGLLPAERIFYRALTTKLQQQSQFIDCRLACVQAAIEIFGPGSPEAIRTGEAFNVVEIFDQAPTPGPTRIPEVAGRDAMILTCVDQLSGQTFLARREAAQGDPANGVMLFAGTPMAIGTAI